MSSIAIFLMWGIRIVFLGVIGWLVASAVRRSQHIDAPLDVVAPKKATQAQLAEPIMLSLIGGLLLTLLAASAYPLGVTKAITNESPLTTVVAVGCFVAALVGFGLAIAVSRSGRTIHASVLLAAVLCVYGFVLNVGLTRDVHASAGSNNAGDRVIVINVSGTNAVGIDLWANGVHLGKTPVRMNLSDLLDTVPDWEVPPDSELSQEALAVDGSKIHNFVRWSFDKRWGTISLPDPDWVSGRVGQRLKKRANDKLFVRTRFEGHDGLRGGGSGASGSGELYSIHVSFRFLHREESLEALMDEARLSDYNLNEEWFEAIKAFGDDGLIAISKAIQYEPQFAALRIALAEREYHVDLSRLSNPKNLLAVLAADAEERNRYTTFDLAAEVVRATALRADEQVLVDRVGEIVNRVGSVSYSVFDLAGTTYYGVFRDGASLRGTGRSSSSYVGFGNGETLSPSDAVYVHALSVKLDSLPEDSYWDLRIRDEVTRAVLRELYRSRTNIPIEFLNHIGGTIFSDYVVKKAQRTRWNDVSNFSDRHNGHAQDLNKWWSAAAAIRGVDGDRFRDRNQSQIFEMADAISEGLFGQDDVAQKLSFLFTENDRGDSSLARRYWPRFQSILLNSRSFRTLQYEVAYLIESEPVFSADEFVELWRNEDDDSDAGEALRQLAGLPEQRRAEVLDAFRPFEEKFAGLDFDWVAHTLKNRGYFLRLYNELRYEQIDDETSVDYYIKQLRQLDKGSYERSRCKQRIIELGSSKPRLVKRLAESNDIEMQRLALSAIADDPTPRNQKLAQSWIRGGNRELAAEAENVTRRWNERAGKE